MKKLLLLTALLLSLTACENVKTISGKEYVSYGLLNEEIRKDPKITYEISAVNVIVAIIFSETLIIPVYVVGWDLYVPVKESK